MRPRHVLVPIDADVGSDRGIAEKLVDEAVELANSVGARVTLAHVAPGELAPRALDPSMGEVFRAIEGRQEARADAAARRLHALEERARGAGAVVDSVTLPAKGTVPETLVAQAVELAADLIVMATHGRRGLRRLVLGSTAERTAHLSSVPVLLLPAH